MNVKLEYQSGYNFTMQRQNIYKYKSNGRILYSLSAIDTQLLFENSRI